MSNANKPPATPPEKLGETDREETVTLSRAQFESVMRRLDKVENPIDVGNPIVAVTCNSCGKPVGEKGRCETHPSEHVNHVAMGIDVETGLKRPSIKFQTRAT